MRACPTREGKGACACSTDQVSNTRLVPVALDETEGDPMHLKFTGKLRPSSLEQITGPLMEFLEREGITRIDEISLNLRAWRGDVRTQIINADARIVSLTIPAEEIVERGIPSTFALPKHLQLRDRPDELDHDGFAMFWGRDD
ncbi:hypothetical protein NTCA1_55290 [Novosphingobium sp. TCA1]|nr:hypothetical protein NTCA1_55290 [Novosphingobium sp. TCA1]